MESKVIVGAGRLPPVRRSCRIEFVLCGRQRLLDRVGMLAVAGGASLVLV
jgi:hypothetical protein